MMGTRREGRLLAGVQGRSSRDVTRRFVFIVRTLKAVCRKKKDTTGNFVRMVNYNKRDQCPARGKSHGLAGRASQSDQKNGQLSGGLSARASERALMAASRPEPAPNRVSLSFSSE
jgi:hypothetical protein